MYSKPKHKVLRQGRPAVARSAHQRSVAEWLLASVISELRVYYGFKLAINLAFAIKRHRIVVHLRDDRHAEFQTGT